MLPILSCRNVSVSFSNKPLFKNIDLHIKKKQRYCLIGSNGAGKSTLLKLLNGDIECDTGEVYLEPGIKAHYLPQDPVFPQNISILDYIDATQKYEAESFIQQFDLDIEKPIHVLSGGEKRRVAIAKALCGTPDLLLLDEPTNHLDIAIIEWLENYLNHFTGAVIVISHDRKFLENMTNKTLWLDRSILRRHDKGYRDYEKWQEQLLEDEEKKTQKLDTKLQQELLWLHQGVTARRRRNQRRLKELHQLRAIKRERHAAMKKEAQFGKVEAYTAPKIIIKAKDVTYGFKNQENKPIIKDFSIQIEKKDRLGIIGPNGAGKTTLLKLLIGELEPTHGKITHGESVELIYFDQMRSTLNLHQTLWQNLTDSDYVYVQGKSRHVMGYLKDFLFSEEEVRGMVGILSGGQRNRLALAKALCQPGNLLVLDEPTNDLDMDTLDLLEDLLSEYNGTLILVSHDRDFLDKLTTSVLVMDGSGTIQEYIGGYSDITPAKKIEKKISKKEPMGKTDKTSLKVSFKDKYHYEQLSKQIELLEKEKADIEHQLNSPELYEKNPDLFMALSQKLSELKKKLTQQENLWFELSEKLGL